MKSYTLTKELPSEHTDKAIDLHHEFMMLLNKFCSSNNNIKQEYLNETINFALVLTLNCTAITLKKSIKEYWEYLKNHAEKLETISETSAKPLIN